MVSVLVLRSVAACALPRPSATASARLANSTVSHSQTVIVQAKIEGFSIAEYVVSTDADLDHEHDRVLQLTRGSSFLNASGSDWYSIFGSSRPPPIRRRWSSLAGARDLVVPSGVDVLADSHQCSPSASGPSASAGK